MRNTTKALALAMIAFFCWASTSEAAFFSFPRALKFQVEQISFNGLALVPVAHTRFCPQYRDRRCRSRAPQHRIDGGALK
jgi:hypothetical protein